MYVVVHIDLILQHHLDKRNAKHAKLPHCFKATVVRCTAWRQQHRTLAWKMRKQSQVRTATFTDKHRKRWGGIRTSQKQVCDYSLLAPHEKCLFIIVHHRWLVCPIWGASFVPNKTVWFINWRVILWISWNYPNHKCISALLILRVN